MPMQPLSVISTPADFKSMILSESIKYLSIDKSSLGGEDRATMFIKASTQNKIEWINSIFHNSPYGIFSLSADDKLQLISKGMDMPKFRKCKVKSLQHAAEKIITYFDSV